MWSRQDVDALYEAKHNATRSLEINGNKESSESDVLRAIATKAIELATARGGTMTAEALARNLMMLKNSNQRPAIEVEQHISVQGARVAVLEKEKTSLEEHVVLLTERLAASEESVRELTKRAQQAESRLEHAIQARDYWRNKAAGFSAAGQVLSEHVDKHDPVLCHCPRCTGAQEASNHSTPSGSSPAPWPETCPLCSGTGWSNSVDKWPNPTVSVRVKCWCQDSVGADEPKRYPCSPTCTHDDARTPGHSERVKERSELIRVSNDSHAAGAEAMRAACWEAVQGELQSNGYGPDSMTWKRMKSAIEGAVP
jgi:hypothetical protein